MNKNLSDVLLLEISSLNNNMTSQEKVRMMNQSEYNEMIKRNAAMIESLLLQNKFSEPTMFVNHLWGNVYRGTVAGLFGKNQAGVEEDLAMTGFGVGLERNYDEIIERFERLSHRWTKNEIAKNAIKSALMETVRDVKAKVSDSEPRKVQIDVTGGGEGSPVRKKMT
jgi:hypothetical protein